MFASNNLNLKEESKKDTGITSNLSEIVHIHNKLKKIARIESAYKKNIEEKKINLKPAKLSSEQLKVLKKTEEDLSLCLVAYEGLPYSEKRKPQILKDIEKLLDEYLTFFEVKENREKEFNDFFEV